MIVLSLVARSGALYYLSNEFSFRVLGMLDPVSQAVANAAKRVFVLAAAAVFLGEVPSARKIVGSCVALLGVLGHGTLEAGRGEEESLISAPLLSLALSFAESTSSCLGWRDW